VRIGSVDWRYRIIGDTPRALLLLPGGELVNDLGFELALALSTTCRVIYPAYPLVPRLEDLADGLAAILAAEKLVPSGAPFFRFWCAAIRKLSSVSSCPILAFPCLISFHLCTSRSL
jgi:hypothetical protein